MFPSARKTGPVVVPQYVLRHVIAGMAIAATGFGFIGLRPDLMVVRDVQFDGVVRAGTTELRHLSDFRNGTTIWRLDATAVAQAIERHPWVKQATVDLRWPAVLYVEVEEYQPVALVHYDGLYYVDKSGTVIVKATSDDLNYPVMTGMGPELEGVHPELPQVVLRDATWLLKQLTAAGALAPDDISEIHFSRERGFTVHALQAQVVFGAEHLDRRIYRLGLMLEHGLKLSQPVVVDLASDSVAIVRPRELSGTTG